MSIGSNRRSALAVRGASEHAARFQDRVGVAVDPYSIAYVNHWLRHPDPRLPPPDLRHWYREPGLWLPLSLAVAFENSKRFADSPNAFTLNDTYTVGSGSDRMLLVWAYLAFGATDFVTSVTYNSVTMNREAIIVGPGTAVQYIYSLINPDSGTHVVTITSAAFLTLAGAGVSYEGVAQTALEGANTNSGNPVTSLDVSITTVSPDCWLSGVFTQASGPQPTPASGCTNRLAGDDYVLWVDKGPVSPDANTVGATGTSQQHVGLAVAFAPSAGLFTGLGVNMQEPILGSSYF